MLAASFKSWAPPAHVIRAGCSCAVNFQHGNVVVSRHHAGLSEDACPPRARHRPEISANLRVDMILTGKKSDFRFSGSDFLMNFSDFIVLARASSLWRHG
jgi:hypothetical protein